MTVKELQKFRYLEAEWLEHHPFLEPLFKSSKGIFHVIFHQLLKRHAFLKLIWTVPSSSSYQGSTVYTSSRGGGGYAPKCSVSRLVAENLFQPPPKKKIPKFPITPK